MAKATQPVRVRRWKTRAQKEQLPRCSAKSFCIDTEFLEQREARRNPARVWPVYYDMRAFILGFLAAAGIVTNSFAAEPTLTKFTVDAVEREALIFLPPTTSKAPVIFAFHGHGGNMRFSATGMAFQNFWPEAIVVYPQGLPTPGIILDREGKKPGWQDLAGQEGDRDIKFVDVMLKTLREKYSIDENRVYATGFSNGGLFSYLLLSQRPDVFAAFAPGGAALLPQVHLTKPRPVLHYGGQSDQLAKFERQQATIEKIRQFNGSSAQGESCGANCTLYPSSKSAPVETFIHPLGHMYPPAVTPVIVNFFKQHPRTS